jgi:hypothetical protein
LIFSGSESGGRMLSELTLKVLEGKYAVSKLAPDDPFPLWADAFGDFTSITRTAEELSVVCPENRLPKKLDAERDWRIIKIEGILDFSLVGILAALASVLSGAGISIFAVSTYNTDYILVRETALEKAVLVLKEAGYRLQEAPDRRKV